MNNIRISVNLAKLAGVRVINIKNEFGKTEQFVAIPAKALFIPAEKPEPFLMATMIHCPDSKYNDFMLKPYMAAADYKLLTQEQQRSIPVIGSGTFMQQQQPKSFAQQAENVEFEQSTLAPTQQTQPTPAPAATQPQNSSLAEGHEMNQPLPPDEFVVWDIDKWVGPFDTFDAACSYASLDQINRMTIECWQGSTKRGRWNYKPESFTWLQAKN